MCMPLVSPSAPTVPSEGTSVTSGLVSALNERCFDKYHRNVPSFMIQQRRAYLTKANNVPVIPTAL